MGAELIPYFICVTINTLAIWHRSLRLLRRYAWGQHAAILLALCHFALALSPHVHVRLGALAILFAVLSATSDGGGRWLRKLKAKASHMMTQVQAEAFRRDARAAS